MADKTLSFDILARDRASQTFDKVGKATSHAAQEAEHSKGAFHGLGETFKHVAEAVGIFMVAEKGFDFLKDSVKAAEAEQQAQAVLERQIHNSTHATKEQTAAVGEWITKQAEATGISKEQLYPAMTKLVAVTHNVSSAQKLASLAMNVSAGTGRSYQSIVDALIRGQNGQVSGLSRLGIATKDAHGKTLSFAKVQENLAKTFRGDAAASADTAAGRMKRLGIVWEDMKVQVGDFLIPILTNLAGIFLHVILPAVEKVGGWLRDKLGPVFKVVGQAIHDFWSGFTVGTDALGSSQSKFAVWGATAYEVFLKVKDVVQKHVVPEIKTAVKVIGGLFSWMSKNKATVATFAGVILTVVAAVKVWEAVTKAFTVVQAALDVVLNANPIGLVVIAIAALAAGLVYAYEHSKTFRDIVQATFHVIGTAATWLWNYGLKPLFAAWKFEFNVIADVARWLWNNALQPVFHLIVGGVAWLMRTWAQMLRGLSHVPGFGWAKGAADAMWWASQQAQGLANNIKKIPPHKTATVTVRYNSIYSNTTINSIINKQANDPRTQTHSASGTSFAPGGWTDVGEQGREMVFLPRGARVANHTDTMHMIQRARSEGNASDRPIIVQFVLDGKVIQQSLLKQKRNNGGRELGIA